MKRIIRSKAGFSLVEIMVATTIGVFIMASSYATIMSLAKGSQSMINFTEMNSQTRMALEMFGRDIRMAHDISTKDETKITIQKNVWLSSVNDYVECDITYEFVPNSKHFTRKVERTSNGAVLHNKVLLFQVETIKFNYYGLIDQADPNISPIANNLLEVKHVQLEAKLQKEVLRIKNTNYIISARFMMRNKDVSYL